MKGTSGFVPNAQLVFKGGCAKIDHCGQIKNANFEKSVIEKLTPNLPPHTAVVLDKASYHCIQVIEPPPGYLLTYLLTYLLIYLLTYLLTHSRTHSPPHSLTRWSKFLLEKLTGSELVKELPALYTT